MGTDADASQLGSMTRSAELQHLDAFQEFVAGCARRAGLDALRMGRLALAFEEIFVNICHYAYPDTPGPVAVHCRQVDAQLVVEIVDAGQAFDATTLAEPDLDADIESRHIGGLGWFLVRQMVDALDCRREEGQNIVRLTMNP